MVPVKGGASCVAQALQRKGYMMNDAAEQVLADGQCVQAKERPSLRERQEALEYEMRSLGIEKYRQLTEAARERGEESTAGAGYKMLQGVVKPLEEAIRDFVNEANSRHGGRRHTSLRFLELFRKIGKGGTDAGLDSEVIAFITARTVINGIELPRPCQDLAISVGSALEDEAHFRFFESNNRTLFRQVQKNYRNSGSRKYRYRIMVIRMDKAGLQFEAWTPREKLQLGMACINMLIRTTGIIKMVHAANRRALNTFQGTAETMAWLSSRNARLEVLSPEFMPMLLPPRDWTTVDDGGYLNVAFRPLILVKTRNTNYLEELRNAPMPVVYEAVNRLQRTAWAVNKAVLDVMERVWDSEGMAGGLPAKNDTPLPDKPMDIITNEEARRQWKRKAAAVHQANTRLRSKGALNNNMNNSLLR
jgi:DNA-directed RNA polymerase, mitochondrial